MHIAAALIIFAGLFTHFFPMTNTPKNQLDVLAGPETAAVVRTQVTPADELSQQGIIKQGHDFSCGSAALATLLNGQFGENFTEAQIIKGLLNYGDKQMISKRRAFSLLDMKRFVAKIGYDGNGYKATLDDLKGLEQPGILPIKIFEYRHFVVFKGIARGHVFLADPWKGNISFTISEFEKTWYKNVIFLVNDDGEASWNKLALSENDLRIIDEDEVRRLVSEPLFEPPPPPDRRINRGPGLMDVYKR